MLTTIILAGRISAQGTRVQDHEDGRVTITTGVQRLTGWPVLRKLQAATAALALSILALGAPGAARAEGLLNVSYDPTRELYRAIDEAFVADWQAKGNPAPQVEVSHGGSGAQARAVIDGLQAQVVTLALAADIDKIAKAGKLPADWQAKQNEAYLALQELGDDQFDIVVPSVSVLAEPPVALVDANIASDDQRKLAEAYLNFLYTPEAQAIIFKNFYRGWDTSKADPADVARFPKLDLVSIDSFGGWGKVQAEHFADGGIFDQIYVPK